MNLSEQFKHMKKQRGPGYKPRTRHLAPDGWAIYTNRLFLETSPYLLQHAHNPVDWHAWGDVGMAVRPESRHVRKFHNMNFMPSLEGANHLIEELRAGLVQEPAQLDPDVAGTSDESRLVGGASGTEADEPAPALLLTGPVATTTAPATTSPPAIPPSGRSRSRTCT